MTQCKTVLVVEDDEDIREAYKMVLGDAGYQVVEAVDGVDGLEKLKADPRPCVVLLDLMMPRLNGVQFLEEMAKDDSIARLPVLVLSAYTDRFPGVAARATRCLGKPVDVDELLSLVDGFCSEGPR